MPVLTAVKDYYLKKEIKYFVQENAAKPKEEHNSKMPSDSVKAVATKNNFVIQQTKTYGSITKSVYTEKSIPV